MNKEVFYISGWEALNIPNERKQIADWHPYSLYFNDKPVKLYSSKDSILKEKGIKKRYIEILKQEYYVANYARAIADLVYLGNIQELKNCVDDFLNDEEAQELFGYLKLLPKTEYIENFMKYELTKLYLQKKRHINNEQHDKNSKKYH